MKKRIFVGFLFLAFIMAVGNAQERRPVAVSPGNESGAVVVGQRCPTFSWSAVEWTTAYKIVVFQAAGNEVMAYEDMEALSYPVLSKEIPGPALSWTPSEEERLMNGGVYVWYVQAVDTSGVGVWSAGRMFQVEESTNLVGVEEKLRGNLRKYGMSEEDIDRVIRDVTPGSMEAVVPESGQIPPGVIKVQTLDLANTFYGWLAGDANLLSTGTQDSFFGSLAGNHTTTGSYNSFFGYRAGYENTTGISNTFIGRSAGIWNKSGQNNTYIGRNAGYLNTIGNFNTCLGDSAGYYNLKSNNTFVGFKAGYKNSLGYPNTFMGYHAGYYNTIGNYNTFLGYQAGFKSTASYNTFIGHQAGLNNTSGFQNTFMGYCAGQNNTTGKNNTFIGRFAGNKTTYGASNTFLGMNAGYYNTGGNYNTFLGYAAGVHNTTGNYNTFLGYQAGWNNTTGSRNVFLGHQAGYNETGSNMLYIDNSGTSTPLIWGDFVSNKLRINYKLGVGVTPTNPIDVAGGAYCTGTTWENASSRELKENIRGLTIDEALVTLEELNPVRFYYKTNKLDESLGFIAEDVPNLVASQDRKGMSAMDVVAVLTKVVQEQQKTISELQKQIDELKRREK